MLTLLAQLALANIVTLDATTETLEVTTSAAVNTDYTVSWLDNATGTMTPGSSHGQISTATTTAILAAPGASTQRAVTAVSLCNVGTASQSVIVKHDTSATERVVARASLAASECLRADNSGAWQVFQANGTPRVTSDTPGFSGRSYEWSKGATAIDTVGYSYLGNKDNGRPGAWSVGTPGVNGVATACDVVGTAGTGGALSLGSPLLPDPASGAWYLTRFGLNAAVANSYQLLDLVWYNTGLAVAAGAQAIVTPAFPARDSNGSADGEGYAIAVYALTALGNAAAVATSTVTYVNSAGVAGRTATFSALVGRQSPTTPVIGTFMPFELQAGDTGVRSISSFNTGTTYTSGTMMLIVYRPIALEGVPVANFPSGSLVMRSALNPGVRIYNDTCFGVAVLGGIATTAPTITSGIIELMER